MLIRLIFLAIFIVFPLGPAMAKERAVGFDLNRIPALPAVSGHSSKDFESETVLYDEKPSSDPALAFQVRLPRDWVKAADFGQGGQNIAPGIIGEVARYYSPPDLNSRSIFSVMTVHIEARMALRDWVVNQALLNGYTLEGIREINGDHVESQYVTVEGDVNYRVRVAAWMKGTRILFAVYKMPIRSQEAEGYLQAMCLSSFKPMALPPDDKEGIDVYNFVETMQFEYPLSWRLRIYETQSLDRMKVTIVNGEEGSASKGWINIRLVRKTPDVDLKNEIDASKAFLGKGGLVVGGRIELVQGWTYQKDVAFGRVEVLNATPADGRPGRYEIWHGVLALNGFLGIVNMVTPARDEMFLTWATNVAVFRRVVETLAPWDGSAGEAGTSVDKFSRYREEKANLPEEADDNNSDYWYEKKGGVSGGSSRGHIGIRQRSHQ